MPPDPKIETVLVCDDVRRELSGKDILIGVYSGGIGIPTLPAQMNVAFWITLRAPAPGTFTLSLRVNLPQKNPAIDMMTMQIDISPPPDMPFSDQPIAVFTPPLPLPITEPGNLELHARWGDSGKWGVALRKPILLVPPSTQPTENNP